MTIFVNEKQYVLPDNFTLENLSMELQLPNSGVALAIDNQVIPRSKWPETTLHDQAKIILIKAVCGG